jgi:hypothetical protein
LAGDPAEGKSRRAPRGERSDWLAVERERGISVSSAVMSFEHVGRAFDLLDMSRRPDFSPLVFGEITYWFRLSVDQPFGCHNRMVFLRISTPTIGRAVRFGGSWRYLIST